MSVAVPTSSGRVSWIDAGRGLAIMAVNATHAMIYWDAYTGYLWIYQWIGRTLGYWTSPGFFMLYGAMLELVYYGKLQKEGFEAVTRRLAGRALSCWLAIFTISVAVFVVRGGLSLDPEAWKRLVLVSLLVRSGGFANILQYYVVLILLSPLLLMLRHRKGIWAPLALGVALWCLVPFLSWLPLPAKGEPFDFQSALITGVPAGPSVFSLQRGVIIVALGMLLGGAVRGRAGRLTPELVLGALVVAGGVAVPLMARYGYEHPISIRQFAFDSVALYRTPQWLGFYVPATAMAAAIFLFVSQVHKYGPRAPWKPLEAVGRNALWAYAWGTCAFILYPGLGLPGIESKAIVATVLSVLVGVGFVMWEQNKPRKKDSPTVVSVSAPDAA